MNLQKEQHTGTQIKCIRNRTELNHQLHLLEKDNNVKNYFVMDKNTSYGMYHIVYVNPTEKQINDYKQYVLRQCVISERKAKAAAELAKNDCIEA